jgi:hypothetical protein
VASAPYRLVLRRRGKVEKSAHPSLDAVLDALEDETRVAANTQVPHVEHALGRSYEPSEQVAVRAEVRGPGGLRAGIDVRGDGSATAYTGVVRRRPLEPRDREDAWKALRRALSAGDA